MKYHLTEQELIEYQFKLVSDDRLKEITGHLQSCARCREDLEQLKRKFASLDLLREETKVSEDLLSRVVEQAKSPVKTKILFGKSAWIGAAAAVLLIGFLSLVAHLNKQTMPAYQTDRQRFAKEPKPTTETIKSDVKTESLLADRFDEGSSIVSRPSSLVPVEEQPPFAPASAIELVVLPRRENVQLTIYNSADLTLVRERRNLTLKKGWNWLQFMWANALIDPTSLSLEPLEQKDKIGIQQLVFPVRLRELGRWLIRSEVTGQVPFEITYFTSGLSWRAFYMGTLSQDEKTMHLQGYVRVANKSGEDYDNAQTRLIVGKVHLLDQIAELARRQYPYGRPMWPFRSLDSSGVAGDRRAGDRLGIEYDAKNISSELADLEQLHRKEIRKEGLSEYFLYTIEGTETIPDKWGKRLLSFEAQDIKVKSLYKYDEERFGERTITYVSFVNDKEHNLGETPIPNGQLKIYNQADEQRHLSYVGGTEIKYIPVNEEIELNLGPVRLVSIEPILMDFKTDNYVFDERNNIVGWDEEQAWKVEITNTRTLPIEVEITRGFDTAYWTLQAEIPYGKHDATHARFKVNLQPRSKRAFTYTVRTYRGVREESLTR
jgi:hypothetical protein